MFFAEPTYNAFMACIFLLDQGRKVRLFQVGLAVFCQN
jgi:hypothetical protein